MLAGISRAGFRYKPHKKPGEEELRRGIRKIAHRNKRYGCRRVWAVLRREGLVVNHKRVHRIWKDEGLSLPRRRPKRRRMGPVCEPVKRAEHKDHVWTYDFMEDRTERGGRLRLLNVVDEYTRECLAIRVEPSIPASKVIETLEWLFLVRGVPRYIRSDNGPEFAARAVRQWLKENGCRTLFIEPGSPWENPYIESFNGKIRDECLNMEIFANVREAKVLIEAWREEYNERRPHSALGYETPAEFGARCNLRSPYGLPPIAAPGCPEGQNPLIATCTKNGG